MGPVFIFPGQGSQQIGMGKAMHEAFPAVRKLFSEASAALGMDFESLCFEGPEATLTQTEVAQPAVTLINLACLTVVRELGIVPAVTAGHSLGEYAALHAAGSIALEETLGLVHFRGARMQLAADASPGGMLAIMGISGEQVEAICEDARAEGVIQIGNYNAPTQTIVTGEKAALDMAAELAKKKGRVLVVPLNVSGPWHSSLMQPAAVAMREKLRQSTIGKPDLPVLSNVTGDYVSDPDEIRQRLEEQIVNPVRWVDSIQKLIGDGHKLFVEIGPGHALSGLMRDIDKTVTSIAVEKPSDLDHLAKLVAQS